MEFNLKYHCVKCNLYFNYKSFYDKHIISNKHIDGKRKERNDKKDNKERTIHKCLLCNYENKNIQNYKNTLFKKSLYNRTKKKKNLNIIVKNAILAFLQKVCIINI